MPQFSPTWFINLISWSLLILISLIWINQSVIFPRILKTKLSRIWLI